MAEANSANRRNQVIIWALILTAIYAVMVTALFIFYFFQVANAAAQRDNAIAALEGQVNSLNTQVASLQNDLNAANARVAPLANELTATVNRLADVNANLTDTRSQLAAVNGTVTALQAENDRLNAIANMTESRVITEPVTIHQEKGAVSSIISFKADYAGYLSITASTSSDTGYIIVNIDNPNYQGNSTKYLSRTQHSFNVPIMPGNVEIVAGNTDKLNEVNHTVGVTYVY